MQLTQGAMTGAANELLGQGNFSDSMQGALYSILQASAFKYVGDLGFPSGGAKNTVAHALAGGLLAEAMGGDFKTGAMAAGASEALANVLTSGFLEGDSEQAKRMQQAAAQLVGIVAAAGANGDLQMGGDIAKNGMAYNRQLHPDEIKFASDEDRVKRYAALNGISEADAQKELMRTAAAMVDAGWNLALSTEDGNTIRAASFLRTELSQNNSNLLQVSQADYYNEKVGLKELFNDKEALASALKNVALVDPKAFQTDPRYAALVLNAKGEGSQQGFADAVEAIVSTPSKTALWLIGALTCSSCANDDIQAVWDSVQKLPEEARFKGYLDNLHIMQGQGVDVVRNNEASSTATGIEIGLAIDGGLAGGSGVPKGAGTVTEGGRLVYLSNSTAPGIRDRLSLAVSDIRANLPREGNVAFAEIDVGALSSETMVMKAYSQFDDRVADFLPKPSGDLNSWVLKPQVATSKYVGTPEGYLRDMDTEFKILETVAQRLGPDSQASGRINLISEKMVCPSCSDIVSQFRERYPNIQLNIFTMEK